MGGWRDPRATKDGSSLDPLNSATLEHGAMLSWAMPCLLGRALNWKQDTIERACVCLCAFFCWSWRCRACRLLGVYLALLPTLHRKESTICPSSTR